MVRLHAFHAVCLLVLTLPGAVLEKLKVGSQSSIISAGVDVDSGKAYTTQDKTMTPRSGWHNSDKVKKANQGIRRVEIGTMAASNAVNAMQQLRAIRGQGQPNDVASQWRPLEEYVKLAGSVAATSNTLRGLKA